MPCIENDRAWLRVLAAYHDSVVHVPGLTRVDRNGDKIKPLGLKEAARIAGLSVSDMGNRVSVNMQEARPTLEGFVRHLLSGMDTSALDEIESACGRVAIKLPDIHDHADLQAEVLASGKEFGDVCRAISNAISPDSHKGRRISRRELDGIHREIDEAVAQLYELLAAVEEVAI